MMFSSMYAYKGDNNYLKSPSIGINDAEELELSFEYYNPEGERSPASMQHDVHAWASGLYIVNVQTTEGNSSFKLQISK